MNMSLAWSLTGLLVLIVAGSFATMYLLGRPARPPAVPKGEPSAVHRVRHASAGSRSWPPNPPQARGVARTSPHPDIPAARLSEDDTPTERRLGAITPAAPPRMQAQPSTGRPAPRHATATDGGPA